MKKLLFSFISFFFFLSIAFSQKNYWQQQVNYTIDVTLNDKDNSLAGYVKMEYYNNSPDTLNFIWIHLWPNAYKNDHTAFSDQLLENGRTDFYFSNAEKKGYINRLDFKVNSITAEMEDHPKHQDIIKLILPAPLPPNSSAKIETRLNVKLPFNFSRGGWVKNSYQITQWYPKPAVYDTKGWHTMPYLDQGEFYSEFGNYQVQITMPEDYIVASTGSLQSTTLNDIPAVDFTNKPQINTNNQLTTESTKKSAKKINPLKHKKPVVKTKIVKPNNVVVTPRTKTMLYTQDNVHDFAWFADKKFIEEQDTLQLASGRIITAAVYYLPSDSNIWKNGVQYIKKTIRTRSEWLGEYPYNTVSVVEAKMGFDGGMEYPTITSISPVGSKEELEFVIEHEVGHNWNYGILASNERDHPWMDEGINSYYDKRYKALNAQTDTGSKKESAFWKKRKPAGEEKMALETLFKIKRDQPIETSSEKFSQPNYFLISYTKTALWLQKLEQAVGTTMFDSCMHEYYRRWQFKHPYPEDFKKVFDDVSGKNTDSLFVLLNVKGRLDEDKPIAKKIKAVTFFSFKEPEKYHYLFLSPAIGVNYYDKLMIGGLIHNYTLPPSKLQFIISPLYATGSKRLNGIGKVSYTWYPGNNGQRAVIALGGASFTGGSFTDSTNKENYLRFSKLVPSLKFVFANKDPRSTITKFIQWKTFFIKEQGLLFSRDTVNNIDIITYPSVNRYLNQLKFVVEQNRALYPYRGEFQIEQGKGFARLAVTGNYFFNYAKGGGIDVRFFAGKFFYLGDKTFQKQFETDPYHLNMSGPKGYEDYTYSNYFIGRNEFEKYPSQQIMIRDGAFKVRTDLLSSKVGKTDNWLAALNFNSTIPELLPFQLNKFIPIKAFLDIGTYAEAWDKKANTRTGRFVYDAGLQISLFKNTVNIYVPILYSKVYRDYFKSTITEKRFWRNISFSIDIQNINLKRSIPQLATL